MSVTSIRSSAVFGLLGALFLPAEAASSPNDNLNERVSAAACEPATAGDRSKLVFTGNMWTFASGEINEAIVVCPVFTSYWDEDYDTRTLNELRLWYQDSTGTSTNAEVSADLRWRDWTMSTSQSVGSVSSNGSSATGWTTRATSLSGVDMEDAQYHVRIRLYRNSTLHTVNFKGLTFYQKP